MNKHIFTRLSKSLFSFAAALLLSPILLSPAHAQNSINTSNVGGVSFGANGPQGFLSFPSAGPGFTVGAPQGGGYGMGSAETSLGATGAQTHDNGYTGREAIRADGNYAPTPSSPQNPITGPGSNFGLMQTSTGLMGPSSVNNAPMPVTASDSGHLTYGFNNNNGGTYKSMYGPGGVTNLINNLLPGVFNMGGQRLPPVSTGSVDINILP
jgi:hypothetical protein